MLGALGAHYRGAYSGLPREAWMLSLALLVNRAGTMVLPFLSLYLTRHLGYPVVLAGAIVSLYGFGALPAAFASGWLSDRIGPVRVLKASLLASGAGYLILGQLREPLAVAAAVFATSFLAESFRPAAYTAITERAEPAVRTRALALVRQANNLGFAIGPVLGGMLAVHHYPLLFVADALTSWLAAILRTVLIAAEIRPARRPAGEGNEPASVWRDRPFVAFLAVFAVVGIAFCQFWSTLPLHLRTVCGFREDAVGLLLAINALAIALFEMALLATLEHRNRLRVAAVGAALFCFGFAILAAGTGLGIVVLAMLVATLGEMLFLPMTNAIAAGRAPAGRAGSYLGAYSFAFSLAFIVGPALGTAVFARWGSTVLWLGVGAIGIPAGFALAALSGHLHDAPQQTGAAH